MALRDSQAEGSQPTVSIALAVWRGEEKQQPQVEHLERLLDDPDVEVILATSSELQLRRPSPNRLKVLRVPDARLVPELWQAGIEAASGEIVALSTSHFTFSSDFVPSLRSAFADPEVVGVGGRIDPPLNGSGVEWATYLLRYGKRLGTTQRTLVDDFAADCGAYRTGIVKDRLRTSDRRGFWEHEFHREMRRDGLKLVYDPSVRVRQTSASPAMDFVRLRFEHGRLFGRERASGLSAPLRWLFALRSCLLLPGLLLLRTARGVAREPAVAGGFVKGLPALGLFACSWSVGEAIGYCGSAEN